MNWLIRFKPFILVPVVVILLSSCSISNEISQTESQITKINQTSSTQAEDSKKILESSLFSGINDYQIDNPKTYYNDEFKFSVDYPIAWEVLIDKPSPDLPNGSPEIGVNIFVDSNKNDSIYVFHHLEHIFIPSELTKEVFITTDGVNGEIRYEKSEGNVNIHLILGEGFDGAYIKMSETSFEKYKEQVFGILKSIKIT